MDRDSRRLRTMLFALRDLETALCKAARPAGADGIARAAQSFDSLSPDEFLGESRAALEAVLLGERDLPRDVMGDILETIATIDELLASSK